MASRPARAWLRRHPHERLVEAYRDAHETLGAAYNARPFPRTRADSYEVHAFLVKLTRASLSLRLLRVLCNEDVKAVVHRTAEKVDQAVTAPPSRDVYEDPEPWLLKAIEAVEEAARRDVRLEL